MTDASEQPPPIPTAHELTIEDHPQAGTIGRCKCNLFSFIGPRDMIDTFYAGHIRYPEVKLTGRGSGDTT